MAGQAILLVEDELLIRTQLADVLGDAGYDVIEASDGDEGLTALADRQFDLLITDVKMPGSVDGLELAACWKQRFPDRPVVISSAHVRADPSYLSDRILNKPFADAELLKVIEELIGLPYPTQTADTSF